MTHQEEIIADVVAYLSGIDGAKTIPAADYTEEREPNMVIVRIDSVERVNFGLDDFKYVMTVIVDTFKDEDKDGAEFDRIHTEVLDRLNEIFDSPKSYGDIFPDLDRIVHFHFSYEDIGVADRSNRANINIEIVGSFN